MKRLTYLMSIALLSSANLVAQDLEGAGGMQRRGTIRDMGVAKAAVLKTPGLPVNRDFTKPVISTTLNTGVMNPALGVVVVPSGRNINPLAQVTSVKTAPGLPAGVILPGTGPLAPGAVPVVGPSNTGLPNIIAPVVTPIVTPIVNPIVPIITPVINPIVPVITPITNPLTPVVTPIVTPIVNPLTPVIKPIVTPIVNPLKPIIKPVLPILPIKLP